MHLSFIDRAWLMVLIVGADLAFGAVLPDPDPVRIKADVDYLCNPDLAGRGTGTPGAVQAAAYLAQRMQEGGLAPIRPGGMGGATPFHYVWTYRGDFGLRRPDQPEMVLSAGDADTPASDVVGVLPGRDPDLKGQFVFVTAHFDHLGSWFGRVYPGADDNASGTAGLLEVMRLLRQAGPRRSIAFLAVSGEEEGLLGSEAFLQAPPLPLEAIQADINMDMIGRGRTGELHIMPARRAGYVTTLTADARTIAASHGVALSAGLEGYWQDSDHYSFARLGIPSICFNTGLHADYHQPTDTPDKIDYAKLGTAVRIVRDLVLQTANADAPPVLLPAQVWQAWTWGPYQTPNVLPEPSPKILACNPAPM